MSERERKYNVTPLPSTDRLIAFAVDGREFGFRRPTTGDVEQATRRYAMHCVVSGMQLETDILLGENGGRLWFQSRLEVGLLPRVKRDGATVDRGERAPDDWFDKVDGQRVITFDEVDDEEFDAVCRHLGETVFAPKKKANPTVNSGSVAPVSTND